eukprot:Skav228641  [mRNA]  locus=scaffold5539:12985:14550:- [translate_table: standard]
MGTILTTFWRRYAEIYPNHEVSQRCDPTFTRSTCIPVCYHGDEGRSLKKKQLMVLATHGALGKGSHQSNDLHNDMDNPVDGPLKLNMVGNTWLTHFLQCVMPIKLYNDTPDAFFKMLEIQAQEFADLFWDGIVINNTRFFVCCVGIKGDAPFLTKSGMFLRSFTRRPTRHTSRAAASGICHLCVAGKEDHAFPVPFEDYGTLSPAWLQTIGVETPFDTPSPLLKIPFESGGSTEQLWKFDLFHNWHSGMGKYFASSAICTCLDLVDATIDEAFSFITQDFLSFCRREKEYPYHKKLSKTLFGVEKSFQDCPDASWSKGDFTRLILKWFGDYCQRHVVGKTVDPLYIKCAEAVFSINQCLGGLYREGVFIKAENAKQLSNQGLTFLRLYGDLARMTFDRNMKRFPLVPKGHYLHHQFLDLLHQSQRCQWCLNILMFGVQMQEDFIGKPSRLSRRVSAQTTSLRVIQRTFLAVRNALGDAD